MKVPPPNEADAVKILFGIKERYEKFHAVAYTDEAIENAVYTSSRFIPDRFLPDKAIDLIDEAGARVKLRQTTLPSEVADIQKRIKFIVHRMENAIANHEFEKARFYSDEERKERENLRQLREKYNLDDSSTGVVTKDDIEDVVARWTGVPMTAIKEEEVAKLLRIEEELHKRIISQEKAISALARAIRRSRAGLKSPKRPAGSFLFLGPTGVGKTEVARALAEFLFGSEKSLIRFDMSEFMEKHSVSKLIGSPPGYVGYEEGGQLTERVKRAPYSIILLDEIEKAHPDIYNILLQVFEDGQLTDGLGNKVDFKNTIIIMTSNLGARFLEKRSPMGFSAPATRRAGQGRGSGEERSEEGVQSRIPEPPGRGHPVHLAHRRRSDQDHRPAGGPDQQESGSQADQDPPQRRRGEVHPGEDLHRPQLRRASAAPGAAEVHRGSAQRSADPGLAAAARRARSLPRRSRHLLRQLQEEPVGVAEGGVAEAPLPMPGTALYLVQLNLEPRIISAANTQDALGSLRRDAKESPPESGGILPSCSTWA